MEYTIRDISEETSCDQCGCPLLPGDKVITDASGVYAFCGKGDLQAWTANRPFVLMNPRGPATRPEWE